MGHSVVETLSSIYCVLHLTSNPMPTILKKYSGLQLAALLSDAVLSELSMTILSDDTL